MIEIETVEEVDGWELGRDADALPQRRVHGSDPGSLAAILQNYKSVTTRKAQGVTRLKILAF